MNITSAQYIALDGVNDTIKVTIDGVEMQVPIDSENRHYQAIIEWASQDGNAIADAE